MSSSEHGKQKTVLIVEDDEADRNMIERFLKNAVGSEVFVRKVEDGEKALDYLRRSVDSDGSGEEKTDRPDLILLDLDLPKLNGLQVLKDIHDDEALRSIPVTVLATSDSEWTVQEAYKLGASSYIVKPGTKNRFEHRMVEFFKYWFRTVELP